MITGPGTATDVRVSSAAYVRPLRSAISVTDCGAKAANQSQMLALGLPIPDGFVLTDHAFLWNFSTQTDWAAPSPHCVLCWIPAIEKRSARPADLLPGRCARHDAGGHPQSTLRPCKRVERRLTPHRT